MNKRIAVLVFISVLAIPRFSNAQITPSVLTLPENEFALDLYKQIAATPGNFIFSPNSIDLVLGMVYAGAKGKTADEMARTLHIDELSPAPGQTLLAAYLQDMVKYDVAGPNEDPNVKLNAANALWGAQGYQFHAEYLKNVSNVFGGALTQVDFSNPAAAADTINQWVAAHTAGKIQNLISARGLGAATRLVLTNAVYFDGGWSTTFDPGETAPAPFHLASGQVVMRPMMNMTDDLSYREADGAQVLTLYYGYGGDAMTIFLPKPHVSLNDVERGLSASLLTGLPHEMRMEKVAVELPKFKAEHSFDLNFLLDRLGIRDLFDPAKADLSGMATAPPGRRLFVSDVVHQAYVAVDETGTVATAATAGVVEMSLSAPDFQPPVPFIADHPFLYMIQDASGQILFMGRVMDPG